MSYAIVSFLRKSFLEFRLFPSKDLLQGREESGHEGPLIVLVEIGQLLDQTLDLFDLLHRFQLLVSDLIFNHRRMFFVSIFIPLPPPPPAAASDHGSNQEFTQFRQCDDGHPIQIPNCPLNSEMSWVGVYKGLSSVLKILLSKTNTFTRTKSDSTFFLSFFQYLL